MTGSRIVLLIAVLSAGTLRDHAQESQPAYHSPIALVADSLGAMLYSADETTSNVAQIDTRTGKVIRTIALPAPPTGLAINKAGSELYVSGGVPSNSIYIVDIADGKIVATIAAGHGPAAPVLSADESILYVCNRFDDDLSVIDLSQKREIKRVKLVREPLAATLTPDGGTLVVGNARPDGPATTVSVSSSVSLVDTRKNEVVSTIHLPNGGVDLRGVAVSAGSRHAFVTHILARNHAPATQLDKGWLTMNAVSIIDLQRRTLLNTVLLDQVDKGAGNPWGVACTRDGRTLLVALSGVHEIAAIDLPPLIKRLEALAPETGASRGERDKYRLPRRPDTDLLFLKAELTRVPLNGKGPRAVVVAAERAYAGMYYSGTIESIELANLRSEPNVIALGAQPTENDIRRGDMLFHDAKMSQGGWQSCSTCHFDDRADGLNWDLTNDGIGNTKNTKSLLYSYATPPVTWTGLFPAIEACVPYEMKTILFASRPKEDAAAIVVFLKSLRPVPSPHLSNGTLSAAAVRGEQIFQKAQCINCHRGEYRTAMEKRNVGTATAADQTQLFDIPTLREVWRTAPYLHDGRAGAVKDIFLKFDPSNSHGKHANLTDREIDDLVEYVLSQ